MVRTDPPRISRLEAGLKKGFRNLTKYYEERIIEGRPLEYVLSALLKLLQEGGKTILPPSEVPGGPKLAMFADPAGNITGLFQGK